MAYIENKAEKVQNQRNAEVVRAARAFVAVTVSNPFPSSEAWKELVAALEVANRCPACDGIGIVVRHDGGLQGCEVCKSFGGYSHPELVDVIRKDDSVGVNCEITLKLIVDFAWPPTAREAAETVRQSIEVREVDDIEALIEEVQILDVHRL